jgi:hypothetical protein
MPCLWLQHNNSQLFISVAIIDAGALPPLHAAPAMAALPRMFVALVDTGAQRTMISTNVVNTLGLQPQGQIQLQGVGPNFTWHNAYLFHVAFTVPVVGPAAPPLPPGHLQVQIHVNSNVVYGGELPFPAGTRSPFDVLLGMDILSSGSLKMEGSGHFSFSF